MALVPGQQYAKKDFGITGPASRRGDHTIGGELYSFFMMTGKWNNIIEADGFVYEVGNPYSLAPPGAQTDLRRHVFVRKAPRQGFTYLGKGRYEQRYDHNHNKVFW